PGPIKGEDQMSIYGAMFSGVTGLAAQSQALGMISDNISNVNTIGYKGTVARFSTLVTEAASVNHYSPGGVRSAPIQRIDRQGLLQGSASGTDIAIVGNGFFVVNEDAVPGVGDNYLFTRAGNFTLDERGYLLSRSEERRVGKECRSRRSAEHKRKTENVRSRRATV